MARVITYRELIQLLSRKIDEPASEGTAGQRLTTNGAGLRTWSGAGSVIEADRIRIDGNEYVVRTGEAGAAGYLTIGQNTLWLGTTPFLLDLGGRGVNQILRNTDVIYAKQSGVYTLFDNGWVDSINWSGNLLTRPNYTSQGRYSFDYVESEGYMRLVINANETFSEVYHNCHVCTTDFVSIPSTASTLNISIKTTNPYTRRPQFSFGLLPSDYVNSMDDSRGGKLSTLAQLNNVGDFYTFSLALDAGMAGTKQYRVVINERCLVNDYAQIFLHINKVWFE